MALSEAEKGFAELHGPGPLTDLEVERALDDLEAPPQVTYDARIGDILDETTDYNDRLETLWQAKNFDAYVRLSERMHEFHQSVEDFLTYQPDDIERNKALEESISHIYSRMMPLDEDRREELRGGIKDTIPDVSTPNFEEDVDKMLGGLHINEDEPPINNLNPAATLPPDNSYRTSVDIPKPENKKDESDSELVPEEDLELIPVPWEKPRHEQKDTRRRDFLIGLNLYASEIDYLKRTFEKTIKNHQPSDKQLSIFHDGLADIRSRLQEYDLKADADVREQSAKAYNQLQDEIADLEDKYPIYVLADISGARRSTRRSIARYVSIQHTLSADERRALRSRIARLSATVRRAEDERWAELFAGQFRNPKREYLHGQRHVEIMTTMKMARARRIAPILANRAMEQAAVHGFPTRPQGVLAAVIKSINAG